MPTMRKRGERILGPYKQHNGYRIIELDEKGDRKSSLHKTQKSARRYKELLEAELESADQTTETALHEYKQHLTASGTKPESIVVVEWAVSLFFPEPVHLSMLSAKRAQRLYDDIRTRVSEMTGKPLANDTHRGALTRVKTFISWCAESPRRWVKENAFATVKGIGKLRPRGKSLGKSGNELRVKQAREWYAKALEFARAGDKGAVASLIALLLGMRAGEIVSRRVNDLDEDTAPGDLLWIPCSKTPAGRRTLEVPEVLRPFLLSLADGKDDGRPLLEFKHGVPHNNAWVRKQVVRICKAAKVPEVTAHAMRGLLATLTSERGMAGHLIAATLGHESYENMTLKAYAAPGSHEMGVNRRGLVVLSGGAK
jgi:integrase